MALFDSTQAAMFQIVESIFGDVAVWNGETITGLLRAPTVQERTEWADSYNPTDWVLEYYATNWDGLKASADAGEYNEITVKGNVYSVLAVHRKYDGKTLVARIEPI